MLDSDDEDFKRAMALSLGRAPLAETEGDERLYQGDEEEQAAFDEAEHEMLAEAMRRTAHIKPPSGLQLSGPGFGARQGDDDDLQRALAMSMQDGRGRADDPIDIAGDDDDEIQKAVQLSLLEDERRKKALEERPVQGLTEEEEFELAIKASLQESEPKDEGLDDDVDSETEDQFFQELNRTLKESKAAERLAAAAAAAERAAGVGIGATTSTTSFVPVKANGHANGSSEPAQTTAQSSTSTSTSKKPTSGPQAARGLPSRAEMEQERLARQKRLQGLTEGDSERESKKPKLSIIPAAPPVRVRGMGDLGGVDEDSSPVATGSAGPSRNAAASSSTSRTGPTIASRPNGHASISGAETSFSSSSNSKSRPRPHPYQDLNAPRDAAGQYYLNGEIRHTYLEVGDERQDADPVWRIGDVMGKPSEMSLLIMSSYDWEFDFFKDHFPHPEACPIIIVRPPNSSTAETIAETNGKAFLLQDGLAEVYPFMRPSYNGFGLMGSCHMKYAWIFYKTGRLRVVVSTANFVERDWRFIENTVFVQDFLALPTPQELDVARPEHDLPLQFRDLFQHIKLGRALTQLSRRPNGSALDLPLRSTNGWASMNRWDWSRVSVKLVMSIPGEWTGEDAGKYGICRIGEAVKAAGWAKGKDERVVADFQSSSLGKMTIGWYTDLYRALGGLTADQISRLPKATTKSEWPPLKIVFPSLATVEASELGKRGGGTMFVGSSWEASTKSLFYDSNSQRGRVLLHAKALTAIYEPSPVTLGAKIVTASGKGRGKRTHDELEDRSGPKSKVGGWNYIGSANFSPSAWGRLSSSQGEAKLNLNNYEMGIILPLPRDGADAMATRIVPHKRPARRYASTDVPWDQKEMDK